MDWNNYKYLIDENIDFALVSYLRGKNFDIKSVFDLNLQGKTDVEILQNQRLTPFLRAI
jgi:predicted nuclease of predicted toxin-antitoxin system